ncbi:protein FAR1-RELATED SEQUENCE 7-like [Ananas comosus]|uniref:Protein FAR1-RELATED SEQUENCE n=1 Tax=Ananas comosus TaxID=4615 RepID=A0A6P5H1H3_ANACO|nr:protein FAR1-RELATED SEQUENCE 7-like [Ananas comosus]XP_020111925.1 protein FAR1-RELATED SEQUENCE 7-like [Ananas comosus]XP_020111927.1 protein FAR1-RELATED SEQUENCE 7-like [Ananas comosus]XP_020111928.1 protein FAR1-RELATED SEQUENCE 7-like [Ananas comosus]
MSSSAENAESANGDDAWVPKIGMVFENDEKAYHFYCHYGKEMGFGVRKHLVKRRSSGLVYSRVFSCYKEGYCRTTKEGKKPRPDARSGCQAHMTVKITDDGRFRVSEFEPNHNHELAPKAVEEVTATPSNAGASLSNIATCRPRFKNFVSPKCMNAKRDARIGAVMRCVQKGMQENREVYSSVASSEETYYNLSVDNNSNECWVPKIDMEFENDEEAYLFYVNYATAIGFSVRKHLIKRRASGIVFSRVYVCHKEGFCRRKEDQQGRSPKPYDRTGCLASMTVKITKNGRYRVSAFEPKHNHALVIPSKAHLVRWQWRKALAETPKDSVGPEDDSKVELECSDEPIDEEDKTYPNLTFRKNYIPSRCTNAMRLGDLGALMQYMHERQVTDPSFYYALQLDLNDQVTNIFWADTKSIVDFHCFGDVVCFDTTFKTNDDGRPFAPFIGVNHHKQAVVFGAAFLYDEREESFKWLFETFKNAMHGKQPKLVLTGQSAAINNAIATVWQGTVHRYCVWQIYNDAAKNLNIVFEGSTTFAKDFSKCLYDCDDEADFLSGWKKLLENYGLHNNEWLAKLYQEKEKWALAYDREIFSADIKSTLVRENMNIFLKKFLDLELDLLDFMKHYEKVVDERRQAEVEADLSSNQTVLQFPSSKMLKQAANAYTPAVFKVFQTEFEFSMDCMVYSCGQIGTIFEYKVNEENSKECIVTFDSSNGAITCSCKRFEFVGIQCRHVLKTLDIINIKELAPQYILKRWTKDAKTMNLRDNCMLATHGDSKSTLARRYSSLCCIFNKIAVRAAEAVESYTFIESLSDRLMSQVVQILQARPPEGPEGS